MSYSDNPKTLEAILPYFAGIAAGQPEVLWEIARGQTKRFAYKLREGLHIARTHPERFPQLAPHATSYIIEEIPAESRVIAKRKHSEVLASQVALTQPSPGHPDARITPVGAVLTQQQLPRLSLAGKQTARTIIGSIITDLGPFHSLHYSEADLTPEDIATLKRWADEQTPRLTIISLPPTVTLTPYNPDLEEEPS